jgi:hypothetical protein
MILDVQDLGKEKGVVLEYVAISLCKSLKKVMTKEEGIFGVQ